MNSWCDHLCLTIKVSNHKFLCEMTPNLVCKKTFKQLWIPSYLPSQFNSRTVLKSRTRAKEAYSQAVWTITKLEVLSRHKCARFLTHWSLKNTTLSTHSATKLAGAKSSVTANDCTTPCLTTTRTNSSNRRSAETQTRKEMVMLANRI